MTAIAIAVALITVALIARDVALRVYGRDDRIAALTDVHRQLDTRLGAAMLSVSELEDAVGELEALRVRVERLEARESLKGLGKRGTS